MERTREECQELARANAALNAREILSGATKLESYPTIINLDLMGVCNVQPACRMCTIDESSYMFHTGAKVSEIVGFGDFLDRCDMAVNCSIGEPTLHPKFLDLAREFHARGKVLSMSSNGLALSRSMVDRLVPYLDAVGITFSLDAATEETFKKIRGDGFPRILDNIAYYCQKKREVGASSRSRTSLCMMPMRCNRHEVAEFVALGARLGADVVELRAMNKRPDTKVVERDGFRWDYLEQLLSDEELWECRREAQEAARRVGIKFECQYEMLFDEGTVYGLFKPKELLEAPTPCVMPWQHIFPLENGDTFICCYIAESIGNWRQQGLAALWNSEQVVRMRGDMVEGRMPEECLRFTSCPVVGEHLRTRRSSWIQEWRHAAISGGKGFVLGAGDPAFPWLIEGGVFEAQPKPEENLVLRWLSERAALTLPDMLDGGPGELHLRARCVKPAIDQNPLRIQLLAAGFPAGVASLAHAEWTDLTFPLTGVPAVDGEIKLEIRCESPWTPSDYWGGSDHRRLSIACSEISLLPRPVPGY